MHTTTYNNVHIASNNARMNIKANTRQTKNQPRYDFIYQIAQYGHIQGKEIQTEKWQRKRYKKNNGIAKEQTQEIGERRQAARKTRSKPQPNKPVKGRRTLY